MNNRLQLLLCSFSILLLFSSPALSKERPKDFRGLVWGTHISKVPDLVLVKEASQDVKFYSRPSDSLKVGDSFVDEISYRFVKDELVSVNLTFKTYEQYRRIKALFLELYGSADSEENRRKSGGLISQTWYADKDNEANITLHLVEMLDFKNGGVSIEWKGSLKKQSGL